MSCRFPLDVGEAVADYLLHARPSTASRALFVTMVAPFGRLGVPSVTCLASRACARAGVARFGPHGMRHAAACELLAGGASMEEIGQLLRHAQERTTAIYAKVDLARLSALALPCLRGAARAFPVAHVQLAEPAQIPLHVVQARRRHSFSRSPTWAISRAAV